MIDNSSLFYRVPYRIDRSRADAVDARDSARAGGGDRLSVSVVMTHLHGKTLPEMAVQMVRCVSGSVLRKSFTAGVQTRGYAQLMQLDAAWLPKHGSRSE